LQLTFSRPAMANSIRDPNPEKVWRQTLTRHAKSGLTAREFCRREGLHESAFYFWRRTIRERDTKQHDSRQCCPNQRGVKQPAFVPLVFGDVHAAAGITLELRGGRSLRLSESFPVDRLATLVHPLRFAERTRKCQASDA
jgi:transposase-like protein